MSDVPGRFLELGVDLLLEAAAFHTLTVGDQERADDADHHH